MNYKINFTSKFKYANMFSLTVFVISLIFIIFKGLNFGIDFKGGTLIEIRSEDRMVNISDIRSSLQNLNLGDINVKQFGKKGDFLIKVEQKTENDNKLIPKIKNSLIENINSEISFRRVENVGPKVSSRAFRSRNYCYFLVIRSRYAFLYMDTF